jgi:hypothetical protein
MKGPDDPKKGCKNPLYQTVKEFIPHNPAVNIWLSERKKGRSKSIASVAAVYR